MLSAAFTIAVLNGGRGDSAAELKAELHLYCGSVANLAHCGQDAIDALLTDTAATEQMLVAVENVLADSPSAFGGCHSANHMVGTTVSGLVGEGQQIPAVGDRWLRCAEGLAHGFLEHVDLGSDPERVAAIALASCAAVGATEADLNLCPHGIGHSLYSSLGQQLPMALDGCATTFKSMEAQQVCARGVYMSHATEFSKSESALGSLTSINAWDDTMPGCVSDDRFEFLCPSMFASIAVAQNAYSIEAFVGWCDKIPGAKTECLDAIALIIGGKLAMAKYPPERVSQVCALYTQAAGRESECWKQIWRGVMDAGRVVDATQITCAAAGARAEECSRVLASYTRENPVGSVTPGSAGR
jgi:hypothetical protein